VDGRDNPRIKLVLTPRTPEGLGRALGEAHRRYAAFVNARLRATGHLFQGRFASAVMDEAHLMAAARYVALNPAPARLAERAEDWRWSSVRAHLARRDDGLVEVAPLLERCRGRFAELLAAEPPPGAIAALQAAETIGRPLGAPAFLDRVAALTGREPRPRKRGPKPRAAEAEADQAKFWGFMQALSNPSRLSPALDGNKRGT
jgi:putative transposase